MQRYESPARTTDNSPRFNDGFGLFKPIESRRDEGKHAFVRAISAAPSGLTRFEFTPTVKTVGYFLSSRWDLIYAARTPPEVLAHRHQSVQRMIAATDAEIAVLSMTSTA